MTSLMSVSRTAASTLFSPIPVGTAIAFPLRSFSRRQRTTSASPVSHMSNLGVDVFQVKDQEAQVERHDWSHAALDKPGGLTQCSLFSQARAEVDLIGNVIIICEGAEPPLNWSEVVITHCSSSRAFFSTCTITLFSIVYSSSKAWSRLVSGSS